MKSNLRVCMLSTMYLRYKNDTRGLMVYETNRNLINAGISVSVVAPNDYGYKNEEIMDNVLVHRFNYFFPRKFQKLAYSAGIPTNLRKSKIAKLQVPFFALSFLKKTIKVAKSCDIIHAQWIASGFIALFAKKFVKKPVVVTVRQVPKKGIMASVNKYVLKNADYVLFNSSYTKKESLKIAKPKKFSIIHNSIDLKKFKPLKSSLRKELKIKKGQKVILFVGLLVEKKGVKYLIEAFSKISKKHKNSVLIISGDGPERENLQNLAKKLKINKKVKFTGTISSDKTPKLFNSADIFVLPSIIDQAGETETLGVVAIEALACKVPVVATRIGGIPDVVDSSCGFLVPQKNPSELAKKIDFLLSNEEIRKKLGEQGRKKVENKFNPKEQTKKLIKVYKSLVK